MRIAAGLLLGVVLVACQGGDAPTRPSTGLAIYIEDALVRQDTADELASRPTDYARGGLKGWTVFGALVPRDESQRAQVLEVVSSDGKRLAIARPLQTEPGSWPVLFVDRGGSLRFTMAPLDEQSGVPHGRGPGDGRGGGNQQGANAPLTLEHVSEIRIAHSRPNAPTNAGAPAPAELRLTIAGKSEVLRMDAMRTESGGKEEWGLRDIVRRRTDRPVRQVVVRGRDGRPVQVEQAAWQGTDPLLLRLNRRGLVKFESPQGDARDVVEIDVILE